VGNDMMREDILALYRPMRLAIPRITGLAIESCGRTDMMRAAKQIGLWTAQGLAAITDDEAIAMVCDVALFEANQRGRVVFDTFYQTHGLRLDPSDRAVAVKMITAWFSLFRVAGKHPEAGLWLEDLLDGDRRLWIMDESMETSVPSGTILGMRLFDAGPFHAGFGIITFPDEETTQLSVVSQERNGRQPFRHSLAATLYGDKRSDDMPPDPDQDRIIGALVAALRSGSATPKGPKTAATGKRKTRR
jgi:hypothetical protein